MIFLHWVLVFLSVFLDSYTAGSPTEKRNDLQMKPWYYKPMSDSFPMTWHREIPIYDGEMTYERLENMARDLYQSIVRAGYYRGCLTARTRSCIVSTLWVPKPSDQASQGEKGWVYASTIVRGMRAGEMKNVVVNTDPDPFGPNANRLTAWWQADQTVRGNGDLQFHAEDGCYFNYETLGRTWYANQLRTRYPYGSRIVGWGVSHATENTNQDGTVKHPCEYRCQKMAKELGVWYGDKEIPRRLPSSTSYSGSLNDKEWATLMLGSEGRVTNMQDTLSS